MFWIETEEGALVDITKADYIHVTYEQILIDDKGNIWPLIDWCALGDSKRKFQERFYVVARFTDDKDSVCMFTYKTKKQSDGKLKELNRILQRLQCPEPVHEKSPEQKAIDRIRWPIRPQYV